MTSRTFTQSPCLRLFLRRASELLQNADNPHDAKCREPGENVTEARGIRTMRGIQIGLHRVVERQKNHGKNSAAKPREPRAQEIERRGSQLRAEPLLFVRKIHEPHRKHSDE